MALVREQMDQQNRRAHIQIYINLVNWFFTKEQRQYNGEKIVFSRNSSRTSGNPHAKKEKRV
jgi:hypothetical protein